MAMNDAVQAMVVPVEGVLGLDVVVDAHGAVSSRVGDATRDVRREDDKAPGPRPGACVMVSLVRSHRAAPGCPRRRRDLM